jgi:hypothetical protein
MVQLEHGGFFRTPTSGPMPSECLSVPFASTGSISTTNWRITFTSLWTAILLWIAVSPHALSNPFCLVWLSWINK